MLPDIAGRVIAHNLEGRVFELYYDSGKFSYGDLDQTSQVTHWQPMPKGPRDMGSCDNAPCAPNTKFGFLVCDVCDWSE